MQELYGQQAVNAGKRNDGDLMTAAADWKNPHQTYTNKKDQKNPGLMNGNEVDRKMRKAQQLHSNIATHTDDQTANSRLDQFKNDKQRIGMASNAGWSDQGGYAKP